MSSAPALQATLSHREVMEGSAEVSLGVAPSRTLYLVLMTLVFVGAMEIGLGVSFMISQNLEGAHMVLAHQLLSLLLPTLLFLLGLRAVNNWYNRSARDRHARLVASYGTPDSVPASFSIEESGLRMATPRGEWLAKWESIHSIRKTHGGWLVGSDLSGIFVPAGAFRDQDEEWTWLRTMLEGISVQAQAKSPEARAVADSDR